MEINEKVNIGLAIKNHVKAMGITDVEFASRIKTTRQNIQSIYRRKSIDSEQLALISKQLDYNFFKEYFTESQLNVDKKKAVKLNIEIEVTEKEMVNLNLKEKILKILDK